MNISLVGSYAVSSLIMLLYRRALYSEKSLYTVSWQAFKHYKDFIYSNTPHALLNSFSHNLPYYVVSHFVGVQAMGFYAIVERTLRVPINLMSQNPSPIFYSANLKHAHTNRQALQSSVILSLISLPFLQYFWYYLKVFICGLLAMNGLVFQPISKFLALGYWAGLCNPPSSAYLIAETKAAKLCLDCKLWN